MASPFYQRLFNRNLLYAFSAVPAAYFVSTGRVLIALVLVVCVVAARFSRPTPRDSSTHA